MKKIIGAIIVITFTILFCTGCEISNTELANSLDGNMTRLVYSVGYLDSVSTTEIQDLTTNTSYFASSSLNNGTTNSGIGNYRNSNYRTNVYSNGLNGGYANYVDQDNVNYANDTTVTENGYCAYCKNPLNYTSSSLTNSTAQSTSNTGINSQTSVMNGGNATATELGGLCDNCKNIASTNENILTTTSSNSANVLSDSEAVNSPTNYVDISLLESSSSDLNDILLSISQKRGIIMLYCTDLRSGKVELSADDKSAISEYITIIKETINYLNNNSTSLTAHMNNIKNVAYTEGAQELINAKLIRVNEVLKTRYAKLDTCIDSLDAIISILQRNVGVDYSASFLNSSSYLMNNNSINETTNPINLGNSNNSETITNSTTGTTTNLSSTNEYTTNTLPPQNTSTTTYSSPQNVPYASENNAGNTDNTIVNYNYAGSNSESYNQECNPNCQERIQNNQVSSNASNLNNLNNLENAGSTRLINNIANENPRGIGIQHETSSPLSTSGYDSTSVSTPKPGALISSIGIKNETAQTSSTPIIADDLSKDNELKLVDNKRNDSINNKNTENNENIGNETTKQFVTESENILQALPLTDNTNKENNIKNPIIENEEPTFTKEPFVVKELGRKTLTIQPIYSEDTTIKLLPFLPNA